MQGVCGRQSDGQGKMLITSVLQLLRHMSEDDDFEDDFEDEFDEDESSDDADEGDE